MLDKHISPEEWEEETKNATLNPNRLISNCGSDELLGTEEDNWQNLLDKASLSQSQS